MSYNVDSWRVKKLADLRVPVASFFKHERKDYWHPEKLRSDDGTLTLDGTMDSLIVEGVERDGILQEAEHWRRVGIQFGVSLEEARQAMDRFVAAYRDLTERILRSADEPITVESR